MKFRYIIPILLIFAFIGFVSAETFTPQSGVFAFKEVENTTINGIDFTVPVDYKKTFSNDTCKIFKKGNDKLKISVVKNGKVHKVKNSKKVKSGSTFLGSVKGYLVDKNSTSYTFSYHEDKKLVVIKSKELPMIMGVMGKD